MEQFTIAIEKHPHGGSMFVTVDACHTYECNYWRTGTKHRPCSCGAQEMLDRWTLENALKTAHTICTGATAKFIDGTEPPYREP